MRALASDYAAAVAWWRDAGVDCDFTETPTPWLREEPVPEVAPKRARLAKSRATAAERAVAHALAGTESRAIGGDWARWPADLAGFHAFWMAEPALDPRPPAERLAPRGEAGAAVMVLTDMPDGAGPATKDGANRLMERIMRSLGIADDGAYFATVLPRAVPLPDWDGLAAQGLGEFTRHHVALARPERIIAFGRNTAQLLEGCERPVLAAPALATLAGSATHRRSFWNAWLEWSA